MSLETYWTIVAPGALFGLSLIGWIALWITRPSHKAEAEEDEPKADPPAFRFSLRGVGVITPETHVRFHEERQHDLFHSTP